MARPGASVRTLRVRAITDALRGSLLFLPTVMLFASIGLEVVLSAVDARYDTDQLPYTLNLSPDAAISLLGTIAGATITTAGVVFSILVVSLQLASGQFSPRVLRGFLRDRLGQLLIGLLMATFAFCVLALSTVDTRGTGNVPIITIEMAMLLALGSIVAIVAYLDRISRRQYVGSIAERIARETIELIDGLPAGTRPAADPPDPADLGPGYAVPARENGWVQQLSRDVVLRAAPPRSVVRIETRVGAFVVQGVPIATIWPPPPDPDRVADLLDDAVIIGAHRTMQQDVDFGLRQLVDIGLRALSAAVNDPTTAIEVVLRVSSILRPLLERDLPPQVVHGEAGRLLLDPWELDHAEYVRHGVEQLRQAAAAPAQPAVALSIVRSLRMLETVAQRAGREEARAELWRQIASTVDGCARAGLLDADLAQVREAAGLSVPR